uniref:Uncharacterized protein n=1 Tax=Ananas comosus var. bracteatus TaxID=296719 RepID=A0A6V7NTN6_ANACO|nr:unnamed protein product [Ananas comosus var. bracteatus]
MRTNGGARDNIAAPAVLPLASPIPDPVGPIAPNLDGPDAPELAAAAAKSVLLSLCLPLLLLPLRGDASFAATALCSARRTSDPFKPRPSPPPRPRPRRALWRGRARSPPRRARSRRRQLSDREGEGFAAAAADSGGGGGGGGSGSSRRRRRRGGAAGEAQKGDVREEEEEGECNNGSIDRSIGHGQFSSCIRHQPTTSHRCHVRTSDQILPRERPLTRQVRLVQPRGLLGLLRAGQALPAVPLLPSGHRADPGDHDAEQLRQGRGRRGPSECDGKYHPDHEMVVALSTGWFDRSSRCLKSIRIAAANGRSVLAKVVDECDSAHGCDEEHDFQPPCRTTSWTPRRPCGRRSGSPRRSASIASPGRTFDPPAAAAAANSSCSKLLLLLGLLLLLLLLAAAG